jgi:hypothetical protein
MTTLAGPITPRQVRARLALLAAGVVSALVGAALLVAWLTPPRPTLVFDYALADLEVGVPEFFRPFEMGGDKEGARSGAWLVRFEDGRVTALWSRDDHWASCVLQPRTVDSRSSFGYRDPSKPDAPVTLLRDPCLGNTFSLDGKRLFGPAPSDLDSFPTRIERGRVVVDFSRVILGACGSSSVQHCSQPGSARTESAEWRGYGPP